LHSFFGGSTRLSLPAQSSQSQRNKKALARRQPSKGAIQNNLSKVQMMSTKIEFFDEINNTSDEQAQYQYELDRAEAAWLQESEGAE
jgi:hypothetical protein